MSDSRKLKLFAGLTVAAAFLAGCGGGDNSSPLELKSIVSGTSSSVGYDQTVAPPVIGAEYQVPQYSVVQAQMGASADDYAVTTNSLPTGSLTNPPTLDQRGVALIRASNFFIGGIVGNLEDPGMDIYLISKADAEDPTNLAAKLDSRTVSYHPIINVPDVRTIAIALRPGYYVAAMRKVPFYPGLKAERGLVIFRVLTRPTIVAGVTTFPLKVTMALPSYGEVIDHLAYVKIETKPLAGAAVAGFEMAHANGKWTSTAPVIDGKSQVYGKDGGPIFGNPISIITSWAL